MIHLKWETVDIFKIELNIRLSDPPPLHETPIEFSLLLNPVIAECNYLKKWTELPALSEQQPVELWTGF